jgi:hypothetical protein
MGMAITAIAQLSPMADEFLIGWPNLAWGILTFLRTTLWPTLLVTPPLHLLS